jgi:hypothetical protein
LALILTLVLFGIFPSVGADETVPKITSWQTFRNDLGYELKVPSCWSASIDNPDEKGLVTAAHNVTFDEGTKCSRPRLDPQIPNNVGAPKKRSGFTVEWFAQRSVSKQ